MPEPITPAPMTAACLNLLVRRFRRTFPEFVAEEEIANQILGRFGFAKLDDGVELHA